jgi:hypothetical protein
MKLDNYTELGLFCHSGVLDQVGRPASSVLFSPVAPLRPQSVYHDSLHRRPPHGHQAKLIAGSPDSRSAIYAD